MAIRSETRGPASLAQYAYHCGSGERVTVGEEIVSFRGEHWTYAGVGRPAGGNSTGRVAVMRDCSDAYDNGHGGRECVHMWHRDGVERTEYFPSVFDLFLGDVNGVEA